MRKMIEKHQVWETNKEWYSALGLTTQSGSVSIPRPEQQGEEKKGIAVWKGLPDFGRGLQPIYGG